MNHEVVGVVNPDRQPVVGWFEAVCPDCGWREAWHFRSQSGAECAGLIHAIATQHRVNVERVTP